MGIDIKTVKNVATVWIQVNSEFETKSKTKIFC